MDINIDTETSDYCPIVQIKGHFGADDRELFVEQVYPLVSAARSKLIIMLGRVPTIDSSGLSCLVDAVTRSRLSQGEVILVAPTRFVMGVFDTAELDGWFDICEDLEQALARVAK